MKTGIRHGFIYELSESIGVEAVVKPRKNSRINTHSEARRRFLFRPCTVTLMSLLSINVKLQGSVAAAERMITSLSPSTYPCTVLMIRFFNPSILQFFLDFLV